ncbi:beta-glucosidase-like [Olea europaea subsp. europaea]|uniref:Beta-glucosidase-like n=1 Tax=Olea europaea subsp. europaea TaxID=158383 RepID=A0A8S0U739_OLEEU|nr:beta-glucosidase-like [Olea europaea subsp. europaea]
MCESNKIDFTRRAFGGDFSFGAATSAYQIEGTWNAGGKGMSNWDYFTQMKPGGVADASNGCVAVDHYNMFKVYMLQQFSAL